MSDPQDLVCVYNATNPAKAELVRNLLEAEGIRAATGDTHNPFPGLSIAPSEVFVERVNAAEAEAVIAAAESAGANMSDDDMEDQEADPAES